MNRASAVHRYGPVLFWALLILAISSIPDLSSPAAKFGIIDKIAHIIEYGILGCLLAFARIPSRRAESSGRIAAVIIMGVLFGCLDELYQSFIPGRSTDPFDVMADALGVISGVLLWRTYRRRRLRTRVEDENV